MSHGDRCFDLHLQEPSPLSQLEHHNNYSIKKKKNYCLTVFPFNYRLSLSSRCVKASQFGEQSEEVDVSLCDRRSKARELSKCHIPCHDECAVTMWSTWSHCPEVGKSLMFMLLYTYCIYHSIVIFVSGFLRNLFLLRSMIMHSIVSNITTSFHVEVELHSATSILASETTAHHQEPVELQLSSLVGGGVVLFLSSQTGARPVLRVVRGHLVGLEPLHDL